MGVLVANSQFADLHLMTRAACQDDKRRVDDCLEQAGLVIDSPPDVAPSLGLCDAARNNVSASAASPCLPHRVLYFSTQAGKIGIVRQLKPALHIDSHIETLTSQ